MLIIDNSYGRYREEEQDSSDIPPIRENFIRLRQ